MNRVILSLAGAAACASASSAGAAIINAEVPSNAYVTIDGLDWAWANPCDAVNGCGDIDLSYQSQFGWRLPTADEFASHPLAEDFVFQGANVPLGGSDTYGNQFYGGSPGGDAACATAFFSLFYSHCDWGDGALGAWYNPSGIGNSGYGETLLVRGSAVSGGVPEPATWLLMILGFGVIGGMLRTKRREAVSVRYA